MVNNNNQSLQSADFIIDNVNFKFSVLMSVYYKENYKYLDESLKSIFNQTIKPDEVVLIEDGKLNDKLEETIIGYKQKYPEILKVVRYENNRGLGKALHDGILECSNEIIFRMDSDDICIENRFEKQLEIFKNTDVDIVGTNIVEYDEEMKNVVSFKKVPESDIEIKKYVKKRNPINHMTVAYKKSAVINAGNYQDMLYFEDYYLWARMVKNNCKFYNVQENLVNARGGNDMIKRRGGKKYLKHIINFEKAIYKLGLINRFEYFINVIERSTVALIPNNVRFLFYKKTLRR